MGDVDPGLGQWVAEWKASRIAPGTGLEDALSMFISTTTPRLALRWMPVAWMRRG